MLLAELRTIDTSKRALRSFGWVVGSVLIGIAAIVWWRHGWQAGAVEYWLAGIGGALVVTGLLVPAALKPVYLVWMALALVLGFVMTRVLLTMVYYLMITPIGFVRRTLGKDPMHRAPEAHSTSYWIKKEYWNESPQRLEKYY